MGSLDKKQKSNRSRAAATRNKAEKVKGATDRSVAPWLVPSPRYFAKAGVVVLLQRAVGGAGLLRSVEADDAGLVREEVALASLRVLRVTIDGVGGSRAAADGAAGGHAEHIAALVAAGENRVNEAGAGSAAARSAQHTEITKADGRIGRGKGQFRGVDGAD